MMRVPLIPLLLVAAVMFRGPASHAQTPKVTLDKPNFSPAFEIVLSSKEERTTAGNNVLIAFFYSPFATGSLTDELKAKEGFVDVFSGSKTSFHSIYNLALDDKIFPSSGRVECFDEKGNWIASLSPLSSKKTRNAEAGDWCSLRPDRRKVGVVFRITTNASATVQDENGLSLGPGKYRLQAILRRRFWSENVFRAAHNKTRRARHLAHYGFDKLDPDAPDYAERKKELEQQAQKDFASGAELPAINEKDDDFQAILEKELKPWLDPKNDDVIFRSNIVEIEVVAPGKDLSDK